MAITSFEIQGRDLMPEGYVPWGVRGERKRSSTATPFEMLDAMEGLSPLEAEAHQRLRALVILPEDTLLRPVDVNTIEGSLWLNPPGWWERFSTAIVDVYDRDPDSGQAIGVNAERLNALAAKVNAMQDFKLKETIQRSRARARGVLLSGDPDETVH